jgi:hypothetical protein
MQEIRFCGCLAGDGRMSVPTRKRGSRRWAVQARHSWRADHHDARPSAFRTKILFSEEGHRAATSSQGNGLAEALLDGLPRPAQGFGDLRPGRALRASLVDGGSLNLPQDLLHLR